MHPIFEHHQTWIKRQVQVIVPALFYGIEMWSLSTVQLCFLPLWRLYFSSRLTLRLWCKSLMNTLNPKRMSSMTTAPAFTRPNELAKPYKHLSASLYELPHHCDFGYSKDKQIWGRIMTGILDKEVFQRLQLRAGHKDFFSIKMLKSVIIED